MIPESRWLSLEDYSKPEPAQEERAEESGKDVEHEQMDQKHEHKPEEKKHEESEKVKSGLNQVRKHHQRRVSLQWKLWRKNRPRQ